MIVCDIPDYCFISAKIQADPGLATKKARERFFCCNVLPVAETRPLAFVG